MAGSAPSHHVARSRTEMVGKMAIPASILDKRGPLSEDEWAVMRGHTVIGERIIRTAAPLAPVARLVRSSHMVSDRVYRGSRSQQAALAELRRFARTQFAPAIVELVCSTFEQRDELRAAGMIQRSPRRSLELHAAPAGDVQSGVRPSS